MSTEQKAPTAPASNGNGNGKQSQALVVGPQARLQNLRGLLDKAKGSIAQVLPKHMTPERLIRIAASAASRQPLLLDCTPESFLLSVVQAGMTGLEPNTPLQHSAIVPLKNNKTGKMEANFWAMYRGLCRLAYNSGEIADISAEAVHELDDWDVEYGTNRRLYHKPLLTGEERGDIVGFYAVGKHKSGETSFVFLSRAEVDAIRANAPGANGDGWTKFFVEMGKKTAIRRWAKTAPLATERAEPFLRAVEVDSKTAIGETPVELLEVLGELTAHTDDTQAQPADRGAALASKLQSS